MSAFDGGRDRDEPTYCDDRELSVLLLLIGCHALMWIAVIAIGIGIWVELP